MDTRKVKLEAYEWARIPIDLPKKNLVLITAKTTQPTIHPEDPDYPIRLFNSTELYESARSLAQRPVGLNHTFVIPLSTELRRITGMEYAFTVDANWNKEDQTIEAMLFLPDEYIDRIKEGVIKKVSVEYTWRDEVRTEKGTEFTGFVFNRVDILEGLNPGDAFSQIRLVEALGLNKKGLMEGDIHQVISQDMISDSTDKPAPSAFLDIEKEAVEFTKRLGEPCKTEEEKQLRESIQKIIKEERMKLYESTE